MEIHFATKNKGKVASLKRYLEPRGIEVIQVALEIPEPRHDDVQEIAKAKVEFAFQQLRKSVVVIDAGFYIHSLNGFPKAFVNFALETIGLEGLLKLVEGKERKCEFRECLAYLDDSLDEPKIFTTHVRGILAESIRGIEQPDQWSVLWNVFIPEGGSKTLGEMTGEERTAWRESTDVHHPFSRDFPRWFVEHHSHHPAASRHPSFPPLYSRNSKEGGIPPNGGTGRRGG